ncbi:MAG: serine O-acetyltransferase [Treponema sp.]|jgi:serine O-acetyltransferase|nr:serine O-acetyltransferase [Treponema sp.]
MFSWNLMKEKAAETAGREPSLKAFLQPLIIEQPDFQHSLAALLANQCIFLHERIDLFQNVLDILQKDKTIVEYAIWDLVAVVDKDPATQDFLVPYLFYKGYHSLELYRIGHSLWNEGRSYLAYYIQSRVSQMYGVDIHPAAVIGKGVFIDHATALVVGETAVIEDNVSILHQVTLGGTGKETGKRHPTVRRNSLLGAGSTILGNIEIGEGAVVGAGSVVLHPVPAHTIAAGIPAENKGRVKVETPSNTMNQMFDTLF